MHGGHVGLDSDRFCWTLVHDGPDAVIYADYGGLIRLLEPRRRADLRLFGGGGERAIARHHHPRKSARAPLGRYGETMKTGKTRYGDGDPRRPGAAQGRKARLDRVYDPSVPGS